MTDPTELARRLRRGADHFESEGDMGMPLLLRNAADAITALVKERDAARNRRNAVLADVNAEEVRADAAEVEAAALRERVEVLEGHLAELADMPQGALLLADTWRKVRAALAKSETGRGGEG